MTKKLRMILIAAGILVLLAVLFLLFFRPLVIPWNGLDGDCGTGEIGVYVQFPVYDKSCEYVTLVIENNTGETAEFGSQWSLEKKVLGQWSAVPFRNNVGFTSELRMLADGGTWAERCHLSLFVGSVSEGEYRIVKKIGGDSYFAEFEIGTSVITAETPYVHEKLENLSLNPDEIPVGNAVMMENGQLKNADELEKFLAAWSSHGLGYQMRSAYRGDEGQVVLEDVTILDDDKILWQADTRRAPNGRITQKYYSNIVTDGERLYLSDWNEYRGDGSERILLNFTLPEDIAAKAAETIQNAGDREIMLRRWSKDGMHNAIIVRNEIGVTHHYEDGGESGKMISVTTENLENPEQMEYVDLQWTDDANLMVMVLTNPGEASPWYYYEFINTEFDETLSYTTSAYEYRWVNDHIEIPE